MRFYNMSEKKTLDITTPIMDNLMQAPTKTYHERHIQDFSDKINKTVTKDQLESVCQKHQKEKAYFSKRELVAALKRPESAAVICKP